ncbi:Mur ligase family protein [Sphingomicrobium clamense]|uniref:UDP-N-acetylmuramoylalanine--D-glutamate ligase n=1 Tax=Sphingomicrobium clamense TaxID=2851013 RepID=A0ABS6V4C0_9SPHN|nr:UDP-N-acetylmuramoyl-L-alanine--D-glutamate ligase [Sphingomicrobium sp. B8]
MILSEAWQGKRYAVYGLARSGLASVEALVRSGAKVACWDDKEEARNAASPFAERIDFLEAGLEGFDALVVSPGVPLNRHPIRELAEKAGCEIIGDVELFARARGTLPEHSVVGITGTNGKSTTTALITHILKESGVPATMSGNIGVPILSQDPLPAGGVYVLELSSYQIDITKSLDCEVAVLLNVTPDHLDRYDGFEAYRDSKLRLFEMQGETRVEIDMRDMKLAFDGTPGGWSASLAGPHNFENATAAILACSALGLERDQIETGLASFAGLPHRMEQVAEKDGVRFVNDSKATNPASAAPALAAYDKVRWIVGGQAKTESLDELEPQLGHVVKAYLIGESEDLWARLLDGKVETVRCGTLEEAVKVAAADASAGEVVLLSPACASFDQFAHFEARGDAFREAVERL